MDERLKFLLDGYVQGKLTLRERLEVSRLFNDDARKNELLQYIGEQYALAENAKDMLTTEEFEGIYNNVLMQEAFVEQPRVRYMKRWLAAASVLLLLGAGLTVYLLNRNEEHNKIVSLPTEIDPGKEGAMLTLADGKTVLLDTIRNGVITLQDGITASIKDGVLQYSGTAASTAYNTMSTPRGRQFHLQLPDGTDVWLNAASSIRYPVAFSGKERVVHITGEAYFEVAKKQQQPFRVSVNDRVEVEVLGTEFNINAYDNEQNIASTLLSGSVRVINKTTEKISLLKPGQQLLSNTSEWKLVQNADLNKVTAWRKGLFNFNDVSLEEAMRQLQRWYDIEVVYENGVPDIELMGEMTKGVSLNGLLIGLGKLGVHYKLEGRKLIILP